jgi:hypothetical protein
MSAQWPSSEEAPLGASPLGFLLRRGPRPAAAAVALALCAVAVAAPVRAQPLSLVEVPAGAIRVDGSLREWARQSPLILGRAPSAELSVAFAYDDGGLYLGATVRDERLVRTARPGIDEDAIVLTFVTPDGAGWRATEVWLYAGRVGESPSSAAIGALGARPLPAPAVRVVEGPAPGRAPGYVLEAHVPWSAIPGGERWQEARGAIRLRDVDSEARPVVEREPASAVIDPRRLAEVPPLRPTGGETALLSRFLASQSIEGRRPRFDLRGNVFGDSRPERVVVVDRFVFVAGAGYRDGAGYAYFDVGASGAEGVRAAELRDLTGDGLAEVLVTVRQSNELGARELLYVLAVDADRITPLFGVETRKETRAGVLQNRVRVVASRRGEPPSIVQDAPRAEGLTSEDWRERPAADVEPILLPWGEHRARTFRWNGRAVGRVSEVANPDYRPQPPAVPDAPTTPRRPEPPPPPPAPPGTDALVAAFRRDLSVAPSVRARFDQSADVAEDARPERLLVLGRMLVVVGAGFRGGSEYFYVDLGVPAEDVLDLRAEDIDGDGRAEVLVRVRQTLGDVRRELVRVHAMNDRGFVRLGTLEVARERDEGRVEALLRIVGQGRARRLEVAPGTARGWSEATYPFSREPSPGVHPLVLPWDRRPLRLRRDGEALIAE